MTTTIDRERGESLGSTRFRFVAQPIVGPAIKKLFRLRLTDDATPGPSPAVWLIRTQPQPVIAAHDQREPCWNCHRHLSDSPVGTRLLGTRSVRRHRYPESQGDASGANCVSVGSLQQNQGSVSPARSPAGPSEMAPQGGGALKVVALTRIRASISSNV